MGKLQTLNKANPFIFLSFFFSILHFLFSSLSLSLSLPLSLSLFLSLSLSLSLSLGGPPLAPGPLDIVHPCHPVATPLAMYINNICDAFVPFPLFYRRVIDVTLTFLSDNNANDRLLHDTSNNLGHVLWILPRQITLSYFVHTSMQPIFCFSFIYILWIHYGSTHWKI